MKGILRRERRTHLLFHALFWALAVVAFYFVLDRLSAVLFPLGMALLLAYLLNPIVTKLHKRGIPRALSILLLLSLLVLLVWLAVLLIIPLVANDLAHFSETVPRALTKLANDVVPWLDKKFGIKVPHTFAEMLKQTGMDAGQLATKLSSALLPVLGATVGSVPAILHLLMNFIMIPVFTFYFLVDFPHLAGGASRLVPPRHRAAATETMREIGTVVSSWVRGQLVVVSILAVLYAIAMSICGIPLAIPVGIIAGLLTFIPYVGTAIGAGLALLMVLLDFSTGALLGVTISFVGLHLLESLMLTPVIVGKKVGLGEAGALIAILVGGELLGFVGILIAVPGAAAVMVVVRRLTAVYQRSDFYTRGGDPDLAQAGALAAALAVASGPSPSLEETPEALSGVAERPPEELAAEIAAADAAAEASDPESKP